MQRIGINFHIPVSEKIIFSLANAFIRSVLPLRGKEGNIYACVATDILPVRGKEDRPKRSLIPISTSEVFPQKNTF